MGINPALRSSHHVDLSGVNLQLDSFEELATPLFDQLYNFAHWLTQNREEAEDLVQETPQSSNLKKKAWGNTNDPNMDSSSAPKTYMCVKWERPTDWRERPNIQKVVGHFLPQPRPLPTCAS